MAVLKKIGASTLMETLVATVLIVIIFTVASMLLNSIFANSIKGNNSEIGTRLHRLQYRYINGKFPVPYYEETGEWEITVFRENGQGQGHIVFRATHIKDKKSLEQTLLNEE